MLRVTVRVKTRASSNKVEFTSPSEAVVWVRARPVDGAANEAVVRTLAEHWKIAPSRVRIRTGASAKTKIIEADIEKVQP